MKNNWFKSGSNFHLREVAHKVDPLPVGIHKLEENPETGELYLTEVQEKFVFPYKIFGAEKSFIERVKITYDNTGGNLGILLSGVKGTGKTVTAELICNILELPVIMVSFATGGLPDFINNLPDDVVIFFDEYEKLHKSAKPRFDDDDNPISDMDDYLLSVMDGSLNTSRRKVFILTTNDAWINKNMLQRPGRIRYYKTFGDLSLAVITEIIDDMLEDKSFRESLIDTISQLEIITIDIVKSMVIEVNIHKEKPEAFLSFFNVKKIDNKYDIFMKIGNKMELIRANCSVNTPNLSKRYVNANFYIDNGNYSLGLITAVINSTSCKVKLFAEYNKREGVDDMREEIIEFRSSIGRHESFNEYTF